MRRFLTACLLLLLAGCGDNAKDLYDTAQLEEKQNRPHATKLSADRRKTSQLALRKSGEDSFGGVGESAFEIYPATVFLRGGFSA